MEFLDANCRCKLKTKPACCVGSITVHIGDHLRFGIIWGPIWGSFAVGDHLRRCTGLDSMGWWLLRDQQLTKDAKYDPELEQQTRQWIEAVLGRSVFGDECGADHMHEVLGDGKVLVELANALRSADPNNSLGPAIKVNDSTMAFKKMENIGNYLKFCDEKLEVAKLDQFQTVDLYEKLNMSAVLQQIVACGRRAGAKGLSVPTLGPKEATENKREFTEEQLKEGKNVIGLQMGTNKLASQAGEHFGRARQVAGHEAYN